MRSGVQQMACANSCDNKGANSLVPKEYQKLADPVGLLAAGVSGDVLGSREAELQDAVEAHAHMGA